MAEDSECKTDNFDERRQPSLGQTEKVESELVRESGNNTAMLGQDASLVTNIYIYQHFLLLLAPNLLGPGEMTHSELLGTASFLTFFSFSFFQHAAPYVW